DGDLRAQTGANPLYSDYATAFTDFRINPDDTLADGNKVVVRYTFTGTHKGALAAIPASGKQVTVQGIAVFRLAGDKADEVRFVWDKFALMQQIGALAH